MPGITDPNQEYFKDGTWSWDGTQWRKAGLLFGYKSQLMAQVYVPNAVVGANTMLGAAVPVGELWVLTALLCLNIGHATTSTFMGVQQGGTNFWAAATGALLALVGFSWSGNLYLVAGDKPVGTIFGCSLNDDLWFIYHGYKMRLT